MWRRRYEKNFIHAHFIWYLSKFIDEKLFYPDGKDKSAKYDDWKYSSAKSAKYLSVYNPDSYNK